MSKKIKTLIFAAALCFAATPFLYIGGQSEGSGLSILGLAIFCVGMAIAPILQMTAGKEPEDAPPTADK
ncbi:MAG: hypothetical protein GX318_01230 [Clostridia bacterium]|nr:hypothetical protein [Clostridia bacterium]